MIDTANELFERNTVSEKNLIKFTIERSSEAMRAILVKFLNNDGEWFRFIKEAKELSWVAFTKDNISQKVTCPVEANIYALS
jgi:hypothetical protein